MVNKVLDDFFENLDLKKEIVPNGSIRWVNPKAKKPMDRIIHRRFYPLKELEIDELEREVNTMYHTQVLFPEWYKTFLKYANGISLFLGSLSLYGLQKNVNRMDLDNLQPFSLYRENLGRHKDVPNSWLFIGSYGIDGTEIVIDTKDNCKNVFCIYNETDKVIRTWENLEDFLVNELNRLNGLYLKKPWSNLDTPIETLPDWHKDK